MYDKIKQIAHGMCRQYPSFLGLTIRVHWGSRQGIMVLALLTDAVLLS